MQRLKNQIAEYAVRVIANIITNHENQQSVKVMSEWKVGEVGMKCFPLDCTTECPHYKTWDMSVDDWTSVCDILKVQVDDCDGDYIRYRCPLDSDKRYTNAIQEGR